MKMLRSYKKLNFYSTFKTNVSRSEYLGGIYMRPGRTQTGMSSYRSPYISFHVFTCNRPKNEIDQSDFVSVADPTRVTLGSETVPFSSKTEMNLSRVHK